MRWILVTALFLWAPLARAADDAVAAPNEAGSVASQEPFQIAEANRLTLSVKHAFAKSEVVARLGYLFEYWKKRFNITSAWRGDRVFLSGSVYGIKVEALFEIDDAGVTALAADPGWPWRGQIMSYVDRKLRKYLHPTYDDP